MVHFLSSLCPESLPLSSAPLYLALRANQNLSFVREEASRGLLTVVTHS